MSSASRRAWLTVAITLLFTARAGFAVGASARFDVILRHGTVFDGTGAPGRIADVAIRADYVAAIGDLSQATAALEIDARGMMVAPGFINIHSHAMANAVGTAENMIRQGVTTEIINADGYGATDIASQLQGFAKSGLAENLGAYVGFNAVWAEVMGANDRRPSAREIERMRSLVVENLRRGAFGVSGGLDYTPAYYARTEEVVAVLRAAAPWRTNFPNHERLTPELGYSSRAGISETIRIGNEAGISPEITHIKVQGHEQGRANEVIAMMSAATASGSFTPSDVYPYLAGQTGLADFFVPLWAQEGGPAAMLARMKEPLTRKKIVAEAERAMDARFGGPGGVYLYESARQLTDVMEEMNVSAGEAVLRLVEERPTTNAILRFGAEADLISFLRNPNTAVACDCGADPEPRTHPRYYGAFPRVLGHYVRETKTLSWEEAILKMTGLPASIIGLVDRGFIARGMIADITVFDPATVIDRATYEHPTLASEGIRDVLVNGRAVMLGAKLTGTRAGRLLARAGSMPTRAMSAGPLHTSAAGELAADGGTATIEFEVAQDPGAAPRGHLKFTDAAKGVRIQTQSIGLVQVDRQWSSFVGVAPTPGGEQRFIVTFDRVDPLDPGKGATLSIDIGDRYRLDRAPIRLHSPTTQ